MWDKWTFGSVALFRILLTLLGLNLYLRKAVNMYLCVLGMKKGGGVIRSNQMWVLVREEEAGIRATVLQI